MYVGRLMPLGDASPAPGEMVNGGFRRGISMGEVGNEVCMFGTVLAKVGNSVYFCLWRTDAANQRFASARFDG